MRTIAKPILVVAVILLGIFAILTLCLNLYLQAQGTQKWLKDQLSGITRTPVSIRGTYGIPLGPIWFNRIEAGAEGSGPILCADSMTIHPDYRELLRGNIVIGRIVLNHPVLRLVSTRLPGSQGSGLAQNSSFGSSAMSPTPPPAQFLQSAQLPTRASSQALPAISQQQSLIHLLHSVAVHRGELTLQDGQESPLLSLNGINLEGSSVPGKGWNGRLEASQSSLEGRLIISGISSAVSLPDDLSALALDSLEASLGGGTLSGTARFTINAGVPRYSISLNLGNASIKQLLEKATQGSSSAEGSISGNLTFTGIPGVGASMQGNGGLNSREVTVQPVNFLKQIGQLLNIDELQLLRLSEGKCLFRIDGGHVVIDDLLLRSENLILAAKGPLHPSGEIDLDSRLLFNEKLTHRLRGLLGSQLSPAPEPGYSQVSFHVSGTALNPKTDLLERLTGLRIGGDLGGLLQGLFGRPAGPQPPPQPNR